MVDPTNPLNLARLQRGLRIACPVCGRGPGEACANPRGSRRPVPHRGRTNAFVRAAGPAWRVWTCEPDEDTAKSYWRLDAQIQFAHDPNGSQAKAAAHAWARRLRIVYPCLLAAVRPAASEPTLIPQWNP
jgi:hypothetical protein